MKGLSKTYLDEKRNQINALNFLNLKNKLMNPEEGVGLSLEECEERERLYKNFLFLILKYPNKSIVPTKQMDEFWHAHILDTRAYHVDCQTVFGYYLHHFPYFGLRGEEDAQNLQNAFMESQRLWKKEFGKKNSSLSSKCDSGGGNCVSTCKKGQCRNCVSTKQITS